MTGAGSAEVAFVKEDSFDTLPGAPTYYSPGQNEQIEEGTLRRSLQRLRRAGDVEAAESIAGNVEGAFTISYVMNQETHDDVRDIVFNDSGTGFKSGLAPTSSWYIGTDYAENTTTVSTAERHLQACIPLSYQQRYSRNENTIRCTLTMGYKEEEKNVSLTPGSVTAPSAGDEVAHHGAELTINSNVQTLLNRATLRFENLYRFLWGAENVAQNAVLSAPRTTLEVDADFDTDERLELAYGSSGTSTIDDRMTAVSGDIVYDVSGTTLNTYSFSRLKPDEYSWNDLVNGETPLTDPTTFHVNGGISIS